MTSSQKINTALAEIPVIQPIETLESESDESETEFVWEQRVRIPIREHWRMGGKSIVGRVINITRYGVEGLSTLDSERESCEDFYNKRPSTGRERMIRVVDALKPHNLEVRLGCIANDFVLGIERNIEEYRESAAKERTPT